MLLLKTTLSSDVLPVSNSVRLVYLLVEAKAMGKGIEKRLPLNMSLVIDKSESMCIPVITNDQINELRKMGKVEEVIIDGVKVFQFQKVPKDYFKDSPRNINFVKSAIHSVVEQLQPEDYFSLILFAGSAKVLLSQRSAKYKAQILEFIDAIDKEKLGDETRMGDGIELGLEEVSKNLSSSAVDRVIVITDGYTLDPVKCEQLAQQAKERGISISTVGLGSDFNEDLMFSISEKSGGKSYFAQEPEEIAKIFADEMKTVQSIVAKKLEFVLRLTTGVEVRNIYRVKPSIAQITDATVINRAISLSFLELETNSTQSMLIELLLPPKKEGTYRIAQTEMSSDLPTGSDLSEKVRGDIIVNYTNSPVSNQLNPDVMNVVERVNAFRLQNKAMEDIKTGNIVGATQKLRSVATRLLELGETELAEAANQEADNLESQGQMSNLGTKKLQYGTRKLGE